ncbi:MAG TPA: AsnC family transcriptional regulator, partial [Vicinamibacteria bacterium]|nr:AsnC family transcriptional regulator [Vicinamibacteria bacterium]
MDRRLLLALSRDGRRTAADLAKDLGLSRQAVAERIRDLERREVIRGYRADVDPAALGLAVR